MFGAAFDQNFDVAHTAAESAAELAALCSSKYVQSSIPSGIYAQVKAALATALANLQLSDPRAEQRLSAVKLLGESNDPQVQGSLSRLTQPQNEPDAAVRAAAAKSLSQVQQRLKWGDWLGQAFSGISLGSILLLAALGLAITYGLLGVINMAHGEMLMLGAYSTWLVQAFFQRFAPDWLAVYPLVALPVAFFITACIGMLLERAIIRHLYGRPLETLLATWGISLMLIQLVRMLFGAQNVEVANPAWLSGGIQVLPNLVLPVAALSLAYVASIARIMRGSMIEVMNSPFIRTARAKGLPMRHIVLRHALRPAMLPVVSYLGPAFVGIITGSIVIETIFGLPGIGQLFVNGALNRDYGMVLSLTILVGALTIAFNAVVDILYALIDPKIRY